MYFWVIAMDNTSNFRFLLSSTFWKLQNLVLLERANYFIFPEIHFTGAPSTFHANILNSIRLFSANENAILSEHTTRNRNANFLVSILGPNSSNWMRPKKCGFEFNPDFLGFNERELFRAVYRSQALAREALRQANPTALRFIG